MPSVCHVSPTYFAPESILGGGERFAEELARAMASKVPTKLVSFGPRPSRERPAPGFERVILKSWTRQKMVPFSPRLFRELSGADVIHCHQYNVLPTFLACLWGGLKNRRVFVTDLGGGAWTPGYQIDPSRWVTAFLPVSEYAAAGLRGGRRPVHVIYGGVDLDRYAMRPAPAGGGRPAAEHDGTLVFLGRILPHKGIHHLIAGLAPGIPLHVIGTEIDPGYRERLGRLAAGKAVWFRCGLSDAEIVPYLQRAMALVHPTPVDESGSAGVHELFGLALVEAMACGCPVVASDAASLPEVVEHEASGLLVAPNDPAAIGAAVERLRADATLWRRLSAGARRRVEERFTWERVVARCLRSYEDLRP